MKTIRRALTRTLAVSIASLLSAAAASAAIDADSADDVCSPSADPCVITETVNVLSGATLDFGVRRVEVSGGGELDFGSTGGDLLCGSFAATASGAVLTARGSDGFGGQSGGLVDIVARRACSADPATPCLIDADCPAGACDLGDATVDVSGNIVGNADPAATVVIKAVDDVSISGVVNLAGNTADADGGELDIESLAGSITISERVDLTAGRDSTGGILTLLAGFDVTLAEVDASGGDFDGGTVTVTAGRDVTVGADINVSAVTLSGSGGSVDIAAAGDITVVGGGAANRVAISADGHAGPDQFSGDGGTIDLVAAGNVVLEEFSRITAFGAQPDAFGGDVTLESGQDTSIGGQIDVRALGEEGTAGTVVCESDGAFSITASGDIDGRAGEGGAASVEIDAAGDVSLSGAVVLTAGSGGGPGFLDALAGGDLSLSGTVELDGEVLLPSEGVVNLSGCSVTVTATGDVDNRSDEGTNVLTAIDGLIVEAGGRVRADAGAGVNQFIHRHAFRPPVVDGTVTPAPVVTLDGTLVGCPVCGNSELEAGETCDDGDTVSGDGCTDDCQSEACIAETPGYPEVSLCDDGVGCTDDACIDDACVQTANDGNCDDQEVCTGDTCDASSDCEFTPVAGECDDADPCTEADACSGGQCSGTPVDCSQLDGVCMVGVCDALSGACVATAAADDTVCDDGDQCTENDRCTGGVCGGDIIGGCSVCGDGLVEGDEDCDDGDTVWAQGEFCRADCSGVPCGMPLDSGGVRPAASDALFVLRAAVANSQCDPRVCDVNDSNSVNVTDALVILSVAVGRPIALDCPAVR